MLLTQFGDFGWEPFADMRRLQAEMNRAFDKSGPNPGTNAYPSVNLWLGDNSIVVTAELPGLSAEDVDLTIREDTLTIRGQRGEVKNAGKVGWHRRERPYGGFSRTIVLPFRVDPDRVDARFDNGVLEIEMQRPEADQPRKIAINGR